MTPASGVVANLSLDALPQLLGAVTVHDQTLCPARGDAPAAFAFWDQARSALLASIVARDVDPPQVRTIEYTRELSANGRHIDKQTVADSIYVAARPVTAMRTAAEFAVKGYRIRSATADLFLGPDADVLLDSAFLRGHCLSLSGKPNPNAPEIGIAFTPTPHQDSIVDVRGVLWLNRAEPAIDSLTFHFTNLSRAETDARSGGDLLFTTMPNGVPMISRWNMHLPLIATAEPIEIRGMGPPQGAADRVVGFQDMGGELAEASWSDATTWIGQLATVGGHVVAAGTGAPVPDATVRFAGTDMVTQTDSSGEFILPMTVPGPYVLEAQDDTMARLGVRWTQSIDVDVARSHMNIQVKLPARVGNADFSHGPRLIHIVDRATGAPIDRATVRGTRGDDTTTSTSGLAALNAFKTVSGYYMIEIRKAGYTPKTLKLRADSASEYRVDLEPVGDSVHPPPPPHRCLCI